MDEKLKRDILELERENMVPILKASGLEFKPDKLLENLEKNQKCITIYRYESLFGLLRYSVDDNGVATIWSIQIKEPMKNKVVMHHLIKKSIPKLKRDNVSSIITIVQKGNKQSLRMHKKLGFEVLDEFEKAIKFELSFERLVKLFVRGK